MKFVGDLDFWEVEEYSCPNCGKSSVGNQLVFSDLEGDIGEYACPECRKVLVGVCAGSLKPVGTPTKPRPGWVTEIEARVSQRFEFWKTHKLVSPDQLPDLAEESFEILWDLGPEAQGDPVEAVLAQGYIFRVGNRVTWQEPDIYEDYERYPEVAKIFIAKYGDRLLDIKVTDRAAKSMLGDSLRAGETIGQHREQFFGNKGRDLADWLVLTRNGFQS
jgi:hypothetical protein